MSHHLLNGVGVGPAIEAVLGEQNCIQGLILGAGGDIRFEQRGQNE